MWILFWVRTSYDYKVLHPSKVIASRNILGGKFSEYRKEIKYQNFQGNLMNVFKDMFIVRYEWVC